MMMAVWPRIIGGFQDAALPLPRERVRERGKSR
jgi:hypothetical protein